MDIQKIIETVFPPIPEDKVVEMLCVIMEEADKNAQKMAEEDPIHKYEKDIYMKLQEDAFEAGLVNELAETFVNNPDLCIIELDHYFRIEHDI